MTHASRISLLASLFCLASGLAAQNEPTATAPSALPIPLDAVELAGQPGLHAWQDGLRGFGGGYRIELDRRGARFLPDLTGAEVDQHLELIPRALMRGEHEVCELQSVAPTMREHVVDYRRAADVRERYEVTAEHVALSWVFDERPAGVGDLIVRYSLDTVLPAPTTGEDGGLAFVREGLGGVAIGGVTGVAADGATVAGGIRYIDGELELRLPAAFVDQAAYPMVLDPIIAPILTWADGTQTGIILDAVYDRASNQYLLIYDKATILFTRDLRGVYVTSSGTVSSPFTIATQLSNFVQPIEAKVANLASEGVFGVAWMDQVTTTINQIRFASLVAGSQVAQQNVTAALSTAGGLRDLDIGCDGEAPAGSGRGFVVVYDREDAGVIEARRIYYDSSGQLVLPPATPVLTDSTGLFTRDYRRPVISRCGAHAGDLLVAAEVTTQNVLEGVATCLIRSDSAVVVIGPTFQPIGTDLSRPAVDGFDGRWVVACIESPSTAPGTVVTARSLRFDGAALSLQASVTFAGVGSLQDYPLVGYAPGRTWLGWSNSVLTSAGEVVAIDSNMCVDCIDRTFLPTRPTALATMTSGSHPGGEFGIVAWKSATNLRAQRLRNYGTAASAVNVGGGCGNGGSAWTSHAPGIGSSGLVCSVNGLPPTALATVFNFAPVQPPIVCGPCSWLPFVTTLQPPIVAGRAEVQFAIPCLPSLISEQFETQWTTLDSTQTACGLFPGLVLSDRVRLTIDN